MSLTYRVTPLPNPWPGEPTPASRRKRAPFKRAWTDVLQVLEREIRHLRGGNVEFALDVNERHLRNDGQLRADARPYSPAVVVSFSSPKGRLQFPCDTFGAWQDNVDAIARALEALRLVDRYGVRQGMQYAGFRAIPAKASTTMTAAQAAALLVTVAGGDTAEILGQPDAARRAIRLAQMATHPDRGGTADRFHQVQLATAAIEAHHGAVAAGW